MEYSFFCEDCSTQFSVIISLKDSFGMHLCCPNCKGYNIKRKFYPIPAIYKADGYTKRVKEDK